LTFIATPLNSQSLSVDLASRERLGDRLVWRLPVAADPGCTSTMVLRRELIRASRVLGIRAQGPPCLMVLDANAAFRLRRCDS